LAGGIKSQHELTTPQKFFPSPTMSTRSVLPPQGLFAGLTADQLIAEEQEHQADELPAPSVLGKRTTPSGDVGSDSEGDGDEEPPGRRGGGLPSHSSPGTHPNPATLQMEQTVRRMAKRLKLPNESISLVEQFSQVDTTNPLFETDD